MAKKKLDRTVAPQKPKKKGPTTKTVRERRFLVCKLTKEEVATASQELAKALDDIGALDDQLSTIKAEYKAKSEKATAEVNTNKRLVRDKQETRLVDCEATTNYTDSTIRVKRLDTNDVVEDRALRGDEKQMKMGFDDTK